jgi:hypothetical protein
MIHVYDEAGNVIETHEHTADFDESLSMKLCANHKTAQPAGSNRLDQ